MSAVAGASTQYLFNVVENNLFVLKHEHEQYPRFVTDSLLISMFKINVFYRLFISTLNFVIKLDN